MRIAFIGQKGIPARSGGVEKHVEHVATRMAKAGHEVFAYVRPHYTDPALLAYNGVHLISLPSWNRKNFDAITHTFFATIHALFQGYDVIHYQSVGPTTLSFLPRIFNPSTRVVTTFHCQDQFHKKWGWFARQYLRLGEYIACKVPHATIVVSHGLEKYALKTYHRVTTFIPNGADIHIGKEKEFDALEDFGVQSGRYILSVGRLVKHKGVHYLIDAFQKLQNEHRIPDDIRLVIVGASAETPAYEKQLRKMGKNNTSIVFTGEQTGDALHQLFANAAVFVQSSESEGMSIALLEAMGYGIPVVASDIDANKEVVGDAGVLFRDRDVNKLADGIDFLFRQPKEAMQLGEKAMNRVRTLYGWDAITDRTIELYQSF